MQHSFNLLSQHDTYIRRISLKLNKVLQDLEENNASFMISFVPLGRNIVALLEPLIKLILSEINKGDRKIRKIQF